MKSQHLFFETIFLDLVAQIHEKTNFEKRLVFMEKGLSYPDKAVFTNAIEHDRGQLEVFVDDQECMYVFDRGYLDYERFDRMTDDGYFFVSRLRKNAVVRVIETLKIPPNPSILSNEIVVLGSTQNRTANIFS